MGEMKDIKKIKQIAGIPFSPGFVERGKMEKIPVFEFPRTAAARTKQRRHRSGKQLEKGGRR